MTVELPWADNQPGISCIPAGTYRFKKYASPTKGIVWITQDVPGRRDIELHNANLARQLEGCIGVGQYFTDFGGVPGVANSVITLKMLWQMLPDEFDLTVVCSA